MIKAVTWAAIGLTLGLTLTAPASAQTSGEYVPQVGQPGKDVIWVPTPQSLVERMLDMAKVTASDVVVDLGSGDGRTVIAAAKRGANALGIEYNADLAKLAAQNAAKEGLGGKARIVNGDMFQTDFSNASVVTMYLLPSLNLKLRPTILDMKPGTRVVSHAFNMAEWQPDETSNVDGYTAHLWIVPAKVAGRWKATGPAGEFDLVLDQMFQKLAGKANGGGASGSVNEGTLRGDSITFTLPDRSGTPMQFRGKVNGNTMEGMVKTRSGDQRWSATRQPS